MTLIARDWLPDTAYSSPALADAVVAAVGKWAERWLGDRAPVAQGAPRAGAERRLAPGKAWQLLIPGVWLEWSEQTQLDYARLALDRPARDKTLGADDRQLLLLLAARMASDLGDELGRLMGQSVRQAAADNGTRPPARGLLAAWSGGAGTAAFELMIAHDALAGLRLRQCPRAVPPARPKVQLGDALAGQQVTVEAVLGAVRITALDLRDIAVGDVVVIERRETDLVELRPGGSTRVLAHAQLSREDGNLILKARMN